MLYFSEVWSHKKNRKGDTPHLYFLEPISSLLVKTWTLVERKTAGKVCQQSEVQSWFLSPFCWHSGHGAVAGKTRDCLEPFGHWAFPQSWKAAPAAGPSLGGKHVESCSSFASQDQSFEGLIISSTADASIPARFHWQLQLPQAAHAPQSPAGPEEQNLDRKLGQRWVLPQYRPTPHSIFIWLKTDPERVKHFACLNSSREESSSADIYRNKEKEQSKPFDFLTSGSGSDSLMNCPKSLTLPKVIFLRREEQCGWSEELWQAMESYILYSFDYILGYILELKQNNNWEEDKNQS